MLDGATISLQVGRDVNVVAAKLFSEPCGSAVLNFTSGDTANCMRDHWAMEEEDDDFYAPSEPVISNSSAYSAVLDPAARSAAAPKEDKVDDELEEGEEEEEEVESDSVRPNSLPACAYLPSSRI